MRDRRIVSNPARGVLLPRKDRRARAYLTVERVELLVTLVGTQGTLVHFLA